MVEEAVVPKENHRPSVFITTCGVMVSVYTSGVYLVLLIENLRPSLYNGSIGNVILGPPLLGPGACGVCENIIKQSGVTIITVFKVSNPVLKYNRIGKSLLAEHLDNGKNIRCGVSQGDFLNPYFLMILLWISVLFSLFGFGCTMGTEHYITDLTLWWVFTTWMAKTAAMGVCPMGFFGFLCQYQCHCQYGAACDSFSGSCFGECEAGFTGKPTCQIENVAYGRETHQEGSVLDTSSLAVDGNIDQDGSKQKCSWAFNRYNPFLTQWHVDLGSSYNANSIQIYFRNDEVRNLQRRAGITVYMSPSEDFRDGEVCYTNNIKDENFGFPPELLILRNCSAKGRFLIITNQRPWSSDPSNCPSTLYSCWAHIEICEVQVFSCTHGTYGPKCNNFCHCMSGTTCNQRTGHCPGKCQAGWTGKRCDHECPRSRFGRDCKQICGMCKDGQECNKVSGRCPPGGCEAGWTGDMCIEPCREGTYGMNCTKLCGQCADWSDCDSVTGVCKLGCQPGWYGERCDKKCEAGKHGEKCDKLCGRCKDGTPCSQVNGECPNKCEKGFSPPYCIDKCDDGFYGENCKQTCGHCNGNVTCDHVAGNCTKGCKPGWTGIRCQQGCKKGTYGQNCTSTCTTCLKEDCNKETGRCIKGCESGWLPPMCNKPCEPGTYGHNCVHTCGACANSETCDHVIGTCKLGCSSGWRGEFCKTACPAGTYGLDCQMKCGHCLNQTKCDNIDGTCAAGCSQGYEGSHCSKVVQKERLEEDMVNTGGIVGGALGFVVIVGLIVLACVVRHWRGGNGKNKRQSVPEVNEEGLYENANINDAYESIEAVEESNLQISCSESTFYANTYYNMGKQSRGIPVVMLEDYITRLHDTPDGFRDQFEELRNCPTLPHVEGQRPENKCKNRFLTTFPYDHSRVVLEELPGDPYSDYINANYIDSVDMERAYIASQGPNHTTITDFWRMVWQEKVEKIVMLANIVENGKVKCEQYWPDSQPAQYKYLLVTVVSIVDLAKYSIRQMTVKNTKTNEIRQIIQFHFTGWPDHGVPDTLELVTFLKRVNSFPSSLENPILVHCSAGVGRTGTFIGLDALYKYGTKAKRLDVLNFVKRMRDNRMTMVQNVEQFILLHTALLEAFSFRNSIIKKSEYPQVYEELCGEKSRVIREEFQCLESTKPTYTNGHCNSALLKENVDKNRSLEVLPVDDYRPYLNTYIPGTNDYVNAVIVPAIRAEGKSIITQTPLPNTVVDFWRLVYDQDCQSIVSLNMLDEDQDDSTGAWWPSEGESVTYGPLVISTTSTYDSGNGISEKLFTISKKGYGDTRILKSFHLSTWAVGYNEPTSTESLLVLMEAVDAWKMECGNESVIIMCMDGASCSGLYSAVSLVLERMRLEQEVDVYHAVRRLQIRRPQCITNIEQYKYIYDVVARHLETVVEYGNL